MFFHQSLALCTSISWFGQRRRGFENESDGRLMQRTETEQNKSDLLRKQKQKQNNLNGS